MIFVSNRWTYRAICMPFEFWIFCLRHFVGFVVVTGLVAKWHLKVHKSRLLRLLKFHFVKLRSTYIWLEPISTTFCFDLRSIQFWLLRVHWMTSLLLRRHRRVHCREKRTLFLFFCKISLLLSAWEKKVSLLLLRVWTEVELSINWRNIASQVIENVFTEREAGVEVSA